MENETKLNLYQKLLAIQKEVIGLGKNKKSNSYEYVTGSKVLEHIKPLMNQYGLLLKQEVISIDNVRQDYKTGIGTNYEKPKSEILTKIMMRFTWVDCDTGQTDESLFAANGQNDWEKGLGSALTYGERYFFLKFFHIATDEDDIDNPDRKPEPAQTPPPPAQTQQQAKPLPRLTINSPEFHKSVEYLKYGYKKPDGTQIDVTMSDLKKQFTIGIEVEEALKTETLKA